jgi:hypothetical protein
MPIELTCSCGKRLRVADAFAGQRGQCPACGDLLQIPACDAGMTMTAPEAAPVVVAGPGLEALPGPRRLEHAVTPSAASAPDAHERKTSSLKEGDNTKLTGVGCVLTLLTVAIIFAVAIPVVRWRHPATGQPLPRDVAIITPLLIGAAFNGIASLLLRVLGVRVWSRREKEADR